MNTTGMLLQALLNRHLYDFLRFNSFEVAQDACRSLRLDAEESEFILALHPASREATEESFERILEQARRAAPHVYPLRADVVESGERDRADFRTALRGRRVALVGPSASVIGSALGPRIESFDLVVRMNQQWPVPEHLIADIGARMDVLYHCCNGDFPIGELLNEDFLKTRFVCYENNIEARLVIRFCARHGLPAIDVSDVYRRLSTTLGTRVNTGLAAISHLLATELAELAVFGVTFFRQPYYAGYRGHGARTEFWNGDTAPKRIHEHEMQPQLEHFARLVDEDPRLQPDEALRDILERRSV